jgi:FMN phosphatase YigB (HAD superfamily)
MVSRSLRPAEQLETGLPVVDAAARPAPAGTTDTRRATATDVSARRLVSGLVLDVGNVLHDATLWRRWLIQLLARVGLQTHYQAFYRVWDREFLPEVHCGRRGYWQALHDYLVAVGLSPAQSAEVIAAGQPRWRELEADARPFPGVLATLARLTADGIRIVALANLPYSARQLQEKLGRMGLGERFTSAVTSCDLGCAKPQRAAYEAALERLGIPAADGAYVGHDADCLAGARSAGLWTIAVNHSADTRADVCMERFEHLAQVVAFRGGLKQAG